MIRGIYSAAAGMMTEIVRSDVTANNLANANTTGFKKDVSISKDFNSVLIERINDGASSPIGEMGSGSQVDEVATIYTGGQIRATGNDLDLAINGKGFFAVQTPNGIRYTRNGSFTRSSRGELVTGDGYRVMGQRGAVRVNDGKLTVNAMGQVFVDGVQTDRLRVTDFADTKQLTKEGSSLFAASDNARTQPVSGQVEQGCLEMSNVNVVSEMVNLIANYRAYEVNGKTVQAHDSLLDKAVNDVGKI
ncbi:MAG: flagellar basal-body rod protein FlgF [Veillonellales bacterium]